MNKLRMNPKRLLFALLILVIAVGAGFFTYNQFIKDDTPVDDGVNYRPPTEQEQAAGDEKKDEIAKEQDEDAQSPPDQPSTQKKKVAVLITDAGQYDGIIEVRSFVPDHYKNGTCTITFKQGTQTVSKKAPAYKDVSTTICTNPLIKRSEFPTAGNWTVTVTYESTDAKGVSKAQTVKIE